MGFYEKWIERSEALDREQAEPEEGIDNIGDLPQGCPLIGGPVPDGCRFEARLFSRMVQQGTLPVNGGCPIRRGCNL